LFVRSTAYTLSHTCELAKQAAILATGSKQPRLVHQEAAMKKILLLTLLSVLILAACGPNSDLQVTTPESTVRLSTPGVNPERNQPDGEGQIAGLVSGLWHGIIAPVMLIGSLFNPAMEMYEVHNNGTEYNVGYLVGIAFVFLLLGLIGGSRRR
jgi:uncharacterized BrkB/YihY/UPF0761 family membrane protein